MWDWLFHQVDVVLGLLTPEQWDALRNTITAVGGLIALFIGVSTYRRNVKLKREEQARLVYATLNSVKYVEEGVAIHLHASGIPHSFRGITLETKRNQFSKLDDELTTTPILIANLVVHNGSKELIGVSNLQLVNLDRSFIYPVRGIVPFVSPESYMTIEVMTPRSSEETSLRLGATIAFSDASGQWWRRHLTQPVRAIHADPGNEMAVAALDKPSGRILLRRWARKVKGQPEIP